MVGFMGCYAAINALKLARHIVRSEPAARVLAVNLELCTLHLHETAELEEILSFLLFADGCAAALVSADPQGVAMESFHAALVPGTRELVVPRTAYIVPYRVREDVVEILRVLHGARRWPTHL